MKYKLILLLPDDLLEIWSSYYKQVLQRYWNFSALYLRSHWAHILFHNIGQMFAGKEVCKTKAGYLKIFSLLYTPKLTELLDVRDQRPRPSPTAWRKDYWDHVLSSRTERITWLKDHANFSREYAWKTSLFNIYHISVSDLCDPIEESSSCVQDEFSFILWDGDCKSVLTLVKEH